MFGFRTRPMPQGVRLCTPGGDVEVGHRMRFAGHNGGVRTWVVALTAEQMRSLTSGEFGYAIDVLPARTRITFEREIARE